MIERRASGCRYSTATSGRAPSTTTRVGDAVTGTGIENVQLRHGELCDGAAPIRRAIVDDDTVSVGKETDVEVYLLHTEVCSSAEGTQGVLRSMPVAPRWPKIPMTDAAVTT